MDSRVSSSSQSSSSSSAQPFVHSIGVVSAQSEAGSSSSTSLCENTTVENEILAPMSDNVILGSECPPIQESINVLTSSGSENPCAGSFDECNTTAQPGLSQPVELPEQDVLAFEPTELPPWRTQGVYDQLWVINRGNKTSNMLKVMENKGPPPTVQQLTNEELNDERLSTSQAWTLIRALRKRPLSVDSIKKLHSRITRSGTSFRTSPAASKPFNFSHSIIRFLDADCISSELAKLVCFYNARLKDCSSLRDNFKLVAYFGAAITSIHPFPDGNGRLARVLLSALMHSFLGGSPVYLCGRSILSTRRVVFLYALEQVNSTWTLGRYRNLGDMLAPSDFCAYIIEAALQSWNVMSLPEMLPRSVVPKLYNVSVQIDVPNLRIEGRACIELDIVKATKLVQLNSCKLYIDSVTALSCSEEGGNKMLPVVRFWEEKAVERLLISFKDTAEIGKLVITILYHTKLKRWLTESELQHGSWFWRELNLLPAVARKLWPCWDEPFFKASFGLRVRLPDGMMALSNMPHASIQSGMVHFATSSPLSSHHVSLVLGRPCAAESTSTTTSGSVCVRFYTKNGSKELARQALDFISWLLDFYKGYFEQPYPLEKLDVFAVPNTIESVKLGCIVLPEAVLFRAREEKEMECIAVHVARLWCETLITAHWWSYSWADTGLARLVAEHALRAWCPELSLEVQGHKIKSMQCKTKKPLQVDVMKVDDYLDRRQEKVGGRSVALFRMVESAVGIETFKAAVRGVMLGKKHSTYSPDDLWSLLPQVGGHEVEELVSSWIRNPSFPVLDVSFETTTAAIKLKQVSFSSREPGKWIVPFACCWGIGGEASEEQICTAHVLAAEPVEIPAPAAPVSWIKIDWGESGYFVVHYDESSFELLCAAVRSKRLPRLERLGVLRNAFLLWSGGIDNDDQLQRCLGACEGDSDEAVLAAAREFKKALERAF